MLIDIKIDGFLRKSFSERILGITAILVHLSDLFRDLVPLR
jgi:hypothetical protein